jgi:mercuric ion transport protein
MIRNPSQETLKVDPVTRVQESEKETDFKNTASIVSFGGILAAFLASLCCLGPVLFAALGVGVGATGFLASTAGFLKAFVPYRPFLIGASLLAIGVGFYLAYRKPSASCSTDANCAGSRSRPKLLFFLWMSTVLILFFVLSPYWLNFFK